MATNAPVLLAGNESKLRSVFKLATALLVVSRLSAA